ncbi:hypothetical protein AB0M19_08710 [Streptomyces sp. NPDC051920]|uniref:hypothetical protein n=1 Tax=Streptomyces sp. NPDC051920 TaxID=3155523 RepID=UPI00342559A8
MDALSRREFLEWAMAESVPVRCPACRREHLYAAPSYPCVCGSPVTAPLDRLAQATPVTHRAWDDEWTTVRCGACGRESQWPQPELGCPCGTTLRIPLRTAPVREAGPVTHRPDEAQAGAGTHRTGNGKAEADTSEDSARKNRAAKDGTPEGDTSEADTREGKAPMSSTPEDSSPGAHTFEGNAPEDGAPTGNADGAGAGDPDVVPPARLGASGHDAGTGRRPAFRPVAIRTARDAVTAAALYLGWLGYRDIRRADQRPTSGIGLAARGILAQVDPTVRPASLRDVECLWLTAMTESAACVFFSLAGYDEDARARADTLGVPLFVLDLTGSPRPANSPADDLIAVSG